MPARSAFRKFGGGAGALTNPQLAAARGSGTVGTRQVRRPPARDVHRVTYISLLLFTLAIFCKPQDTQPSRLTLYVPLAIGIFTLSAFLITQLRAEGRFTARPREVDFLALLCLAAFASIPLAASKATALATFSDMFIKAALIFIMIINVIRTEKRLHGLISVTIIIGTIVSLTALNNRRLGVQILDGYRATGNFGGVLQDPNDMSLFLVILIPIAVVLLCTTRSALHRAFYIATIMIMLGGIFVSYSRGGFLGLIAMGGVLMWKLARRDFLVVSGIGLVAIMAFALLAPANYQERLASISAPSTDASATQRQEILKQSVRVAWRHPLFGVGIGCFSEVSLIGKVTHNAYTQVASEMGLPALIAYLAFLFVPFARLRRIENETFHSLEHRSLYFMSVGLQAALAGYLVSSFFLAVAYYWDIYYLIGFAVCLRRIYETRPRPITVRALEPLPFNEGLPA